MIRIQLGEVTARIQTWNPSRDPDSEFTYLDLSSVDNQTKAVSAPVRLSGSEAPSRARQLVRSGDILVSTVRPNLNAVAFIGPDLDGATASTGFTVLRPTPELDSRYLFHWVRSTEFISDMVRRATGASYPAVSDRIVKDSSLPIPPLDEQHRIAATLDRMDCLRYKQARVLKAYRSLTANVFSAMFRAPDGDVKGGSVSTIGHVLKFRSGAFLPASQQVEGPVPVYGGNGINGHHQKAMFDLPKVVVGRVGAYCGVVHLTEGPSWITDNALYVSEMPEGMDAVYLAEALRAANLNNYASRSGQPLVSAGRIAEVPLYLPPPDAQHRFAKRAERIRKLSTRAEHAMSMLDELAASLRARAFSGQM